MGRKPQAAMIAAVADQIEAEHSGYRIRRDDTDRPVLLGKGGSSAVYAAKYRGQIDRAIKALLPEDDLLDPTLGWSFTDSFRNEQVLLSQLSHEHLASLVDFGEVQVEDRPIPFVVTQLIGGDDLNVVSSGATDLRWDALLRIMEQTASAIEYLHSRQIMHCDIKPANIRVELDHERDLVRTTLIDLGVARSIPVSTPAAEFTYFFSTPAYTLPELRPYVANKSGNRIPWDLLSRSFPSQDLYGLGRTLNAAVTENGSDYPPAIHLVLKDLANKLEDGSIPTASDALRTIRRLRADGLMRMASPEMVTGLTSVKKIRTPSGMVGIDGRIGAFVDHPVMQRLRNVPQLDMLDQVQPGATHSRFLHSIETLDLARASVSHLLTLAEFAVDLTPVHIDGLIFRSLLSNTGHYHLLHVFEDIIEDRNRDDKVRPLGLLTDDELFFALIGLNQESPDIPWARRTDSDGNTLRSLVRNHLGEEWIEFQRELIVPRTALTQTIAGLIQSPIDLEKLVYLRDDAYFTGMPFGAAVDPEAIIASIRPPGPQGLSDSHARVHVYEDALAYIEASIFARFWQIQMGYWHRANRSMQSMAKFVIASLIDTGSFDFHAYLRATENISQDGALRYLSGKYERSFKEELSRGVRTNPLKDVLMNHRSIYERVLTLSPKPQVESRQGDEAIFQTLQAQRTLEIMALAEKLRVHICSTTGLDLLPGDIVIDLPKKKREEGGGEVVVWSDDGKEMFGNVMRISPLLRSLTEGFDLYAKRMRVFCHPRHTRQIEPTRFRQEVLDFLRAEFVSPTGR